MPRSRRKAKRPQPPHKCLAFDHPVGLKTHFRAKTFFFKRTSLHSSNDLIVGIILYFLWEKLKKILFGSDEKLLCFGDRIFWSNFLLFSAPEKGENVFQICLPYCYAYEPTDRFLFLIPLEH